MLSEWFPIQQRSAVKQKTHKLIQNFTQFHLRGFQHFNIQEVNWIQITI